MSEEPAAVSPSNGVAQLLTIGGARRRFYCLLGLISLVGVVFRIIYVVVWRWRYASSFRGDELFFRTQALQISEGRWLANVAGVSVSDHPPLFGLLLSTMDLARLFTYGEQLLFVALIASLVVPVVGLAGMQVGGERVGLIAACLGVCYPGFWLPASQLSSGPLAMLIVGSIICVSYSLARSPDMKRSALLGALCGLATLTRSELILLVPLVVWALALGLRAIPWMKRFKLAAMSTLVALAVLAPWSIRNVVAYHAPEFLSTEAGVTLAWANCPNTYYGPDLGGWSFGCTMVPPKPNNPAVSDYELIHQAESYAFAHISRWPEVIWAREGRIWGFYALTGQANATVQLDNWPFQPSLWLIWSQYFVIVSAIVGAVALQRRRIPLAPLVGVILLTVLVVAVFTSDPRYRSVSEVSLVILCAVGLDRVLLVTRSRRSLRKNDRHRAKEAELISASEAS